MPRIHQKKEEYMSKDTENLIRNKMRGNVTQKELGEEFGLGQRAVSTKLGNMSFKYSELVTIFKKLNFTDEEILKCMRG